MKPRLLIGLGNPGISYRGTRHNVGFALLDQLASQLSLTFRSEKLYEIATFEQGELSLVLVKPRTFMNLSGKVIAPLQLKYRFNVEEDLMVITDNVDLAVGRVRLKKGNSGSTHNGLRSINASLGSKPYSRLLIGVGSVPERWQLADWVLSAFSDDEKKELARVYDFLSEKLEKPPASFDDLIPEINSFR